MKRVKFTQHLNNNSLTLTENLKEAIALFYEDELEEKIMQPQERVITIVVILHLPQFTKLMCW